MAKSQEVYAKIEFTRRSMVGRNVSRLRGICFTELFQKNFSVGSDGITSVLCSVVVSLGMTLTAQQLEVVPIKSDLRIMNRDRIYFDSMVNDFPRLINPTA